jgi:transposase-like protein
MTKKSERIEARRLRGDEGWAITDIAQHLGVSKSSVSVWVRDIELTDKQLEAIKAQHYAYGAQHKGSQANIRKHRELRRSYQEAGRQKAQQGDPLHLAGCMLYWAEGRKSRHTVRLVNSDPDMLVFFLRFLTQSLGVQSEDVIIHINCYTDNGLSVGEIETYWLGVLDLPETCLRKTSVNNKPRTSDQKGRKLLYGTCDIGVYSVALAQHIYGAIQEYIGVEKPEWIDLR